jgi:hypothetical protein
MHGIKTDLAHLKDQHYRLYKNLCRYFREKGIEIEEIPPGLIQSAMIDFDHYLDCLIATAGSLKPIRRDLKLYEKDPDTYAYSISTNIIKGPYNDILVSYISDTFFVNTLHRFVSVVYVVYHQSMNKEVNEEKLLKSFVAVFYYINFIKKFDKKNDVYFKIFVFLLNESKRYLKNSLTITRLVENLLFDIESKLKNFSSNYRLNKYIKITRESFIEKQHEYSRNLYLSNRGLTHFYSQEREICRVMNKE